MCDGLSAQPNGQGHASRCDSLKLLASLPPMAPPSPMMTLGVKPLRVKAKAHRLPGTHHKSHPSYRELAWKLLKSIFHDVRSRTEGHYVDVFITVFRLDLWYKFSGNCL